MRDLPKDLEAEVTFLPTESGGRNGPAFSGYRPQFYYDGHDWDAEHSYPDVAEVRPGDTVRVFLALASPEFHVGKISPRKMFLLREGHKVVGYGKVTKIMDLEESARRIREKSGGGNS